MKKKFSDSINKTFYLLENNSNSSNYENKK